MGSGLILAGRGEWARPGDGHLGLGRWPVSLRPHGFQTLTLGDRGCWIMGLPAKKESSFVLVRPPSRARGRAGLSAGSCCRPSLGCTVSGALSGMLARALGSGDKSPARPLRPLFPQGARGRAFSGGPLTRRRPRAGHVPQAACCLCRPPLAGRAGAGPLGPGAAAPARLAARSFWRPRR